MKISKGFTLIELLIVIAILGVLAAAVLVLLNPIEQLARGRDAGRKSTVGQLTSAMQAYYTSQNATYPTGAITWITTLVTAGELKSVPPAVNYSITGHSPCTTNSQNGYCYSRNLTATEAIIYTRLESSSEESKCSNPTTQDAFFYWSSQEAKAGVVCVATGAEPTAYSGYTYL